MGAGSGWGIGAGGGERGLAAWRLAAEAKMGLPVAGVVGPGGEFVPVAVPPVGLDKGGGLGVDVVSEPPANSARSVCATRPASAFFK